MTEERLVLHVFGDGDAETAAHVASCSVCRDEETKIREVLAVVDDVPVPAPPDGYAEAVWNRVRWKLTPRRRRRLAPLVAAAMVAVAFVTGLILRPRPTTVSPQAGRRVLRAVVDEHLDDSERVLLEVANADPTRPLDVASESKRAGELVAANRIYRQTAAQRGDRRIASLLSDLEPVLVEISHSGTSLSADEVASLQRRIRSKGLLFQVRVVKGTSSI